MSHIESFKILGIDPGTNYMGYGVIEVTHRKVRCVTLGVIDMHKMGDPYAKLKHIFDSVGAIIDEHSPREVALEAPFFGENVQSMLKLGRAQGVAMSAALSREVDVFEYAPSRVKQSITGRGSATKEQIAQMLSSILSLPSPLPKLDATDALAVALCHHFALLTPLNGSIASDKVKGLGGGRKADRRGGSSSWEEFVKTNQHRVSKKP